MVTWMRRSQQSLAERLPASFLWSQRSQAAGENDNKHEDEFLTVHLLLSHDAATHVQDQPQ